MNFFVYYDNKCDELIYGEHRLKEFHSRDDVANFIDKKLSEDDNLDLGNIKVIEGQELSLRIRTRITSVRIGGAKSRD